MPIKSAALMMPKERAQECDSGRLEPLGEIHLLII
jgi:hypothetical protein